MLLVVALLATLAPFVLLEPARFLEEETAVPPDRRAFFPRREVREMPGAVREDR